VVEPDVELVNACFTSVVANPHPIHNSIRNPQSAIHNGYDSPMRRVILKAIAVLVSLAVMAAAGGYHYLRRSLPQMDGTTRVAGLSAPIEIIRDADAIPHIVASNKLDGLFGLGYAHAQDRLWQMEFQRRIGHGRLSEVLGAATLPQDRFLRTVGFARAARPGPPRRIGRSSRSTRTSPASTRSSRRITAQGCRLSSRCSVSSRSRGPQSTSWSG
jgi:hypothetical protein